MEELAIFRIFACFPLAGLLLPDVSSWLIQSGRHIPYTHIYIGSFLLLSIIICTAGIWYKEGWYAIKNTPGSKARSIQG